MSGKYSWKAVANTAKKWVDNKVTETTTADRRTRQRAEGNEQAIEDELEAQAGGAVLTTLFPGLGRALDRQAEQRERAEIDRRDQARSERVAAVLDGSSVDLRGFVSGRVEALAVTLTHDVDEGTLLVLMETVDPVPLAGGALSAAGFAIAEFRGPGTYALEPYVASLDPGVHHVVFNGGDNDTDWFYWSDEYGPATAVVSDDAIDVTMRCRSCGSEEVDVTLRVPLT